MKDKNIQEEEYTLILCLIIHNNFVWIWEPILLTSKMSKPKWAGIKYFLVIFPRTYKLLNNHFYCTSSTTFIIVDTSKKETIKKIDIFIRVDSIN